jgi:hypothetical protein
MQDGNQDDGANESNDNAALETEGRAWKQEVRQETTNERAYDFLSIGSKCID